MGNALLLHAFLLPRLGSSFYARGCSYSLEMETLGAASDEVSAEQLNAGRCWISLLSHSLADGADRADRKLIKAASLLLKELFDRLGLHFTFFHLHFTYYSPRDKKNTDTGDSFPPLTHSHTHTRRFLTPTWWKASSCRQPPAAYLRWLVAFPKVCASLYVCWFSVTARKVFITSLTCRSNWA